MLVRDLKKTIRTVPDFPKPGVSYKDISTLFRNPLAFRSAMDRLIERYHGEKLDAVAGIDARGFSIASVLAYRLSLGLILVRKAGKLPAAVETETYELEYGEAKIEVHKDAIGPGQRAAGPVSEDHGPFECQCAAERAHEAHVAFDRVEAVEFAGASVRRLIECDRAVCGAKPFEQAAEQVPVPARPVQQQHRLAAARVRRDPWQRRRAGVMDEGRHPFDREVLLGHGGSLRAR